MIISDWSSDLKVDASSTFAHIVEYVFLKKITHLETLLGS